MFMVTQLSGFGAGGESVYVPTGAASPPSSMTSNTAPSGYTATGNDDTGGGSGYYTAWSYPQSLGGVNVHSGGTGPALPIYRQIQAPAPFYIASYRMCAQTSFTARAPTAWTLQYSDDGSSWTTADSQSGQSLSAGAWSNYSVAGPHTPHAYWKINCTAGGSTYLTYGVEFFA